MLDKTVLSRTWAVAVGTRELTALERRLGSRAVRLHDVADLGVGADARSRALHPRLVVQRFFTDLHTHEHTSVYDSQGFEHARAH